MGPNRKAAADCQTELGKHITVHHGIHKVDCLLQGSSRIGSVVRDQLRSVIVVNEIRPGRDMTDTQKRTHNVENYIQNRDTKREVETVRLLWLLVTVAP